VVFLRTSTTNGCIFFWGGGVGVFVAIETRVPWWCRAGAFATWWKARMAESLCNWRGGGGLTSRAPSFNYTLAL
jgi:hypothetical protein